jgi:hypothetical protein
MAKVYAHPDYPSLSIIEAQSVADKPQPGAFFVTHQTVVLSEIAKRAYGMPQPPTTMLTITKRINRSQYNMQKCFYRYKSDSCSSARVPSSGATGTSTWGPGAWLSLCNADRAGADGLGAELSTKYQVIWVPPATGQEPWDLAPKTQPVTPPATHTDPIHIITPPSNPSVPGIDLDIGIKVEDGAEPEPEPHKEPEPEPLQKAGGSWILAAVLGGAALITVIVFAAKKKKKEKKGKR